MWDCNRSKLHCWNLALESLFCIKFDCWDYNQNINQGGREQAKMNAQRIIIN